MITGAELFVKALKAEQVSTLFAYPGGQAIDLFDALYGEDSMELIIPALKEAGKSAAVPVLIEFIIEREENVLPIVPPGNALDDMILEYGG